MNVLFTSAGRRVELLRYFSEALKPDGLVVATDMDGTAPALYAADRGIIAPPVADPSYVGFLLELVRTHHVDALVPLLDPELLLLANAKPLFRDLGCQVLVMEPEAVAISADKWRTYEFFTGLGIPSPRTRLPAEGDAADTRFPIVVKPRHGSSGKGVQICHSHRDVTRACRNVDQPLIQEHLIGDEVTVDILGDLSGLPVRVVQRKRLKVRGGEVERGITMRDPAVEDYSLKLGSALRPVGCINVQCFMTESGPCFTEINARFGGGYPLAQAAGAGFPELIVQMLTGRIVEPRMGGYEPDTVMMRYDAAIIKPKKDLIHA